MYSIEMRMGSNVQYKDENGMNVQYQDENEYEMNVQYMDENGVQDEKV